jgi:hypothetical protein
MDNTPSLFKRAVRLFHLGDGIYTFGSLVAVIAALLVPVGIAARVANLLAWVPNVLPLFLILMGASVATIYTVSWFVAREVRREFPRPEPAPAALNRYDAALAAERNKLKADLAVSERERRGLDWLYNRGSLPPRVGKLLPRDDATARLELARLDSALRPLSAAIESMGVEICSRFNQANQDKTDYWLAGYLRQEVFGNARRTLALLRTPKDEDPRAAFVLFWELYKDIRNWIPRAATMQGRDVRDVPGYAEWCAADAKFFEKVNELPSIPAVDDLRMLIIRDGDSGYPPALPAPSALRTEALPSPEVVS